MHKKDLQILVLDNKNFDEQLAELGRILGYSDDQIEEGMKQIRETDHQALEEVTSA